MWRDNIAFCIAKQQEMQMMNLKFAGWILDKPWNHPILHGKCEA
jgi:hypothetical protein